MSITGSIITGLTSATLSVSQSESEHEDFQATFSHNVTVNSSSDDMSVSQIIWITIIVVVSSVFLVFLGFVVYWENRRFRSARLAQRTIDESLNKRKAQKERYLEIEKWLVNKRAEVHDETCDNTLLCGVLNSSGKQEINVNRKRSLTDSTSKTESDQSYSASSDIEEGHHDECSICFDVFQPGEIVSWSPEPKCQHIFHHKCIKEWLLKKTECPCCREIFLPVDRIQGTMNVKKINELILAQHYRSAHCFYCIKHGIVRPSRSFIGCPMNKVETDAIIFRSESVPSLEQLQRIRGVADNHVEKNEKNEDTMHSLPSGTTLSSIDESSIIAVDDFQNSPDFVDETNIELDQNNCSVLLSSENSEHHFGYTTEEL